MAFLKQLAACAAALASAAACAAGVSDVAVRAVSPWQGLLEISWTLDAPVVPVQPNGRLVQTVTIRDAATGSSLVLTNNLAEAALLPRSPHFKAGPHRLVWTPADPAQVPARGSVEVAILETTSPLPYCVVDLSGGAGAASHRVSYLEQAPASGWTDAYKTDYLVLRLVEPGTFTMGDQVHGGAAYPDITLTQPYYIGVFETTEAQWSRMGGSASAASTLPATGMTYVNLRGGSNGRKWPTPTDIDSGERVALSGLRDRTGLAFDLPTEAQWELAARAGTAADYGNGTDWTSSGEDAAMDAVGRYKYNGSSTAPVGSYAPNAWGLYDMHGNVQELCLDRWATTVQSPAVDPVGSSTASAASRVVRGGSWQSPAADCTSAARASQSYSAGNALTGFRLACPAPPASESVRASGASAAADLALDARDPLPVGGDPLPIDFDPLYAGVDPAAGDCVVRVTLDGAETLVETNGFGRLEGWTAHWYTNTLRHVVLRGGVEVGAPLERVLVSTLGPESLTLGECVNAPALEFTAGGTGGWSRDTVTNLDGVVSLRSRDTGDDGCTWLEATVVGEGTLTFWWKVSSEGSKKTLYDYMTFSVDQVEVAQFGWEKDWTQVTYEVKGEGEHVLRWAYEKDDQDADGDDCGWLDQVSWSGAVPKPPPTPTVLLFR